MRIIWAVLFLVVIPTVAAHAALELGSPFSSHMVLQRELPVPVWGWAEPGEKIIVHFAGQSKNTEADDAGRWKITLDPLQANAEAGILKVEGKESIQLNDILVGEVWICSGQSNMEFGTSRALNWKMEAKTAKQPKIRLFNVPGHKTSPFARNRCPGAWVVCSAGSVSKFSAVGYFFGRRIHQELKVPIGLIGSNWGGTRIEPWVSPDGFRAVPELKSLADQTAASDLSTPKAKSRWEKYISKVEAWVPHARSELKAGNPLPAIPGDALLKSGNATPAAIYNAMVHPLGNFAMRGAIWYQGESNGKEGMSYYYKKLALIRGWRKRFNPELAFYWVQLADYRKPNPKPAGGDGWARLREAQRKALDEPHTGMAVIIDIGNAKDIHPRNKQDVGWRLSQWALHQTYGKKDLVPAGPLFKTFVVEAGAIRISFDHVGAGLMIGKKEGLAPTVEVAGEDGVLRRFAIAGEDQVWHWAQATIDGSNVVVRSDKVQKPVAVRYAFSTNPDGANLYNKDGIPASPFRTDSWKK